jgi:hypothetical protein
MYRSEITGRHEQGRPLLKGKDREAHLMRGTHLTLWYGVSAEVGARYSKREIVDLNTSITLLVLFAKDHGRLAVEDWSMFGDTNISIDIPFDADGPARLTELLDEPDLLVFTHYTELDECLLEDGTVVVADPVIVATMKSIAEEHGIAPSH